PDVQFQSRCNLAMVALEPLLSHLEQELRVPRKLWHASARGTPGETDEAILRRLLESHFRYTGSFRAKAILHDWINARTHFVKVMPHEYQRALGESTRETAPASTAQATVLTRQQNSPTWAKTPAFPNTPAFWKPASRRASA